MKNPNLIGKNNLNNDEILDIIGKFSGYDYLRHVELHTTLSSGNKLTIEEQEELNYLNKISNRRTCIERAYEYIKDSILTYDERYKYLRLLAKSLANTCSDEEAKELWDLMKKVEGQHLITDTTGYYTSETLKIILH